MEFEELPIYLEGTKPLKRGREVHCRACRTSGDSAELFTMKFCESWIQEIFEAIGGFPVSQSTIILEHLSTYNSAFQRWLRQ
jgi:hypothetical protein